MVHTRSMRELLAGTNAGFQVVNDPNATETPLSDYEYEEEIDESQRQTPFGPRAGDDEEVADEEEGDDFEFEEFEEDDLDEEVDDEDEFDDDDDDLDEFDDDDDDDDEEDEE